MNKKTFVPAPNSIAYEHIVFINPDLPICFQIDRTTREPKKVEMLFDLYNVVSKSHKPVVKYQTKNLTAPKGVLPLHWHEHLEIVHFVDGIAKITYPEGEVIYHPGDTAVITPGKFHKMEAVTDDIFYGFVIIDHNFLLTKNIDVNRLLLQTKINDPEIDMYFDKIAESLIMNDVPLFEVKAMAWVTLMYAKLYSHYRIDDTQNSFVTSHLSVCTDVIKYISKNFREKINLEDIAHEIGVSKFHMCRCFKEYAGYSIIDFVNLYKLERAKELLISGAMNPSQAANYCGFSSLSYFSKTFKKFLGVSPTALKIYHKK